MKVEYRGHEIEVTREYPIFGRDKILFYSVFRKEDGYECTSGFSEGRDSIRDMVKYLKQRVNAELLDANPWGEKEE